MRKVNILFVVIFFSILLFIPAWSAVQPEREFIRSERRRAADFPALSFAGILNREVMDGVEDYARDQVVFRDGFRAWKAFALKDMLFMKENNGLYRVGDGIYRLEYPFNKEKTVRAAEKFSGIAKQYFPEADVYYSVIPDKNYFVAGENGYPEMDYESLFSAMRENMAGMSYIDITGMLETGDYYRTDLHWKQEEITDTADFLLEAMGKDVNGTEAEDYEECVKYDSYYGSYASQSGWRVKPDTIRCLTNPVIESAVVTDYEKKAKIPVYAREVLSEDAVSMDEYDVYLSGAKALLTLENPKNPDGGELVLFRDSFGSSIAPLLLRGYSKITMIDLRYVVMEYAARMVELPEQCDVLFLYNTQILNHSDSLR